MACYCAACGKVLVEDARFCSFCGKPVIAPREFRQLVRPRAGRKIAGVCRGLADYLGWDVTLLRVVTVLLAIVTFPLGIIAYLIFWLVMPEEPLVFPPATSMNRAA